METKNPHTVSRSGGSPHYKTRLMRLAGAAQRPAPTTATASGSGKQGQLEDCWLLVRTARVHQVSRRRVSRLSRPSQLKPATRSWDSRRWPTLQVNDSDLPLPLEAHPPPCQCTHCTNALAWRRLRLPLAVSLRLSNLNLLSPAHAAMSGTGTAARHTHWHAFSCIIT